MLFLPGPWFLTLDSVSIVEVSASRGLTLYKLTLARARAWMNTATRWRTLFLYVFI